MATEYDESKVLKKKAMDIVPNHYAIWCTIGDSDTPVLNPIVSRRWSEDGKKITFMLDSHNFMFKLPDEEVDVVEYEMYPNNPDLMAKCDQNDADRMKVRPDGKPTCSGRCNCKTAYEESKKNVIEPYKVIFEPFDRMVIQFAVSRNRPRGWYTYNAKSGDKDTRIFSLEKTQYKDSKLTAYRMAIGPLAVTVGW